MSTPPDIFLSYNREDQAAARRFAEAFEAQGFSVWWDTTLRAGEAYDEVTETALKTAEAVVVLWSKKSVVSRWVRAEATLADRNRTLVPAMIEPCERPIMFELTQTADLSRWSGDASDRTWQAFLSDVQRFVHTSGDEPDVRPSSLLPAAASSGPPVSKDDRPSLAILPFTNRSGEKADDVFADGMVEDLVSALSLSGGLKVIAQSATIVYRKNVRDLRTIGQELGARYLLEGNVRRVGTSLRVTAQLVEADTGAILWSQKFDRPLTELADLQEQLVTEVAGHLGVQVERIEMGKALKKPGDLNAWESVMRSLAANYRVTSDGLPTALSEARKAVAIAPDYALGHATLTSALALNNWHLNGGRNEAMAREARAHAERALALDSYDPMVLNLVAEALCFGGLFRDGLRYAQRAVELNPNSAASHASLALACIYFKQPDEAIAHLDAYAVLAPRSYQTHIRLVQRGVAHFLAGRYEQALDATEQSLLLNADFMYALKDVAVYSEKLGRHEEAHDAIRHLRTTEPSATLEIWEARSLASVLPPDTAVEMFTIFRKVWLETPVEPSAA